jgi:CubicO group peptidase (beta-lactamase class C family)
MFEIVTQLKQKGFYCIFIVVLVTACKNDPNEYKKHLAAKKDTSKFFRSLLIDEIGFYQHAVQAACDTLLDSSDFNGSILVAKNGEIIFEKYQGYADFEKKTAITTATPFHLASISKTFTAMAILRLSEQGKLKLDDSLQIFFPGFPYPGITIKMLLCHRSGLPNYLHFMDKWESNKIILNNDVIDYLFQNKPAILWPPDSHFSYCNTNYVILATLMERVTGKAYPVYLKEEIFKPLGMRDSYVFTPKDTASYTPTWSVTKPYPMDEFDFTYGDKNVYSTVRDLLRWDGALYQNMFVSKKSTELAFTPMSHEKETMHNYGLGWRLFYKGKDTLIYHNGKWHGSNTLFNRWVQDTATVIVLSNKTNTIVYQMKQLGNIFHENRGTSFQPE